MQKGFNEEYVEEKMNYYENLAKEDASYEDELLLYQLLYATLIFQDGEVTHNEVTIQEFLDAYHYINNLFPIKNRIIKKVQRKITERILNLDYQDKEINDDIYTKIIISLLFIKNYLELSF